MKKHFAFSTIFLITWIITAMASAEMYKYIDENGQKRWTDDITQVPPAQRSSIKSIESIQSEPEKSSGPSKPEIQATEPAASGSDSTEETSELSREALETEKAALDALYQELLTERKALEELKAKSLDKNARDDLNKRIDSFNSKTKQYESQLAQFNKKINDFNQKIISTQPSPESK